MGESLTSAHPVVRTNPVTGWKSLYAVGNHVQRIEGVTPGESARLQDYFLQMVVEEHDTQLRHRWENPFDVGEYPTSPDPDDDDFVVWWAFFFFSRGRSSVQ